MFLKSWSDSDNRWECVLLCSCGDTDAQCPGETHQRSNSQYTSFSAATAASRCCRASLRFRASRRHFCPPLTLTLNYDPSNFPVGSDQSKLYIAWWDTSTGQWVNLPSIVDQVNHTVTAQVPHFTLFSVLVPLQPAAFSISNLSIIP